LRRDHLGSYGYARNTSPYIDQLARQGVRFEHVITPMPVTAASHASILTSLHPFTHNLLHNGAALNNQVRTIAEKLKDEGYYTVGAIAVKLLSGNLNFSQGFDGFSDRWKANVDFNSAYERTAQSVNNDLFKQIDAYLEKGKQGKQKPLFIWVHYFDPHWPYREFEDITFTNKLPDPGLEQRQPLKRYDKEIRYLDGKIEELHKFLENKGLKENLITCLTADHGEHFAEHGFVNCHVDFYSETTFVPLILQGKGIPAGKTVDTYVSTMDIAVTLLDLVGLTFKYPVEGVPLLANPAEPGPAAKFKNRKFLVGGFPYHTRSLQLVGYPYDLILNFDHHYSHWHITDKIRDALPEDRFQPVSNVKHNKKDNSLEIPLPHVMRRGLNYAVLRADIVKHNGLAVQVRMNPLAFTRYIDVFKTLKHMDVLYPIAVSDKIWFHLKPEPGTELKNLRYTFISRNEFQKLPTIRRRIMNVVYSGIKSHRKERREHELYDLSVDVGMLQNKIADKKLKSIVFNYKKMIYTAYRHYYKKGLRLLSGFKEKSAISDNEKKMLKSLGYL